MQIRFVCFALFLMNACFKQNFDKQGRQRLSPFIKEFQESYSPLITIDGPEDPNSLWVADLLLPSKMFPSIKELGISNFRALFLFQEDCSNLANPMSNLIQDHQATLRDLVFKITRMKEIICKNDSSELMQFLQRQPLMHVAGHSFVRMALEAGLLKSEEVLANIELRSRMHIDERNALFPIQLNPSEKLFAELTYDERNSFVLGEPIVFSNSKVLIKESLADFGAKGTAETARPASYRVFTRTQWNLFFSANLLEATEYEFGKVCEYRDFGPCWKLIPRSQAGIWFNALFPFVVLFLVILVFALLIKLFLNKKNLDKDRVLVIGTLAHELRTPVTALQLGIDKLREDFDKLSPGSQKAVLGMFSASNRMSRLAKDCASYLGLFQSGRSISPVLTLNENPQIWFQELVESLSSDFIFECDESAITLSADFRWLEIILSNFVRNALEHGKPNFIARFEVLQNEVKFSILDGGSLPKAEMWKSKAGLTIAHSKYGGKGLGLGLAISKFYAKRMKARIQVRTDPTCVSVSLRIRTNK
jgi:hypothetical protein